MTVTLIEVCLQIIVVSFVRRTPGRSRGMSARWSRCDIAATVDHAHAASVKSVASGFWPAAGPTRAISVPGRSAPASSSSRASDLPAFATAGMDGATRVWRLTRRDESSGGDRTPSDGSEGARTPFAATLVASVEGANDERGIRAVAMTNDDSEPRGSAALATGSYDGAATIRRWRFHDAVYEASASTVKPHRESVLSLAFSPDGAFLVTGSGDGVARVWSADETFSLKNEHLDDGGRSPRRRVATPKAPAIPIAALAIPSLGAVRCVDAAPLREAGEQDLVATGGEDGTVRVWSWREPGSGEPATVNDARFATPTSDLTCELMLKGHAGGVTAMALCPVFRETVRDRDHVRGARTNSTNSTNSARGGPSRPSAGASFRVAAGGDGGALVAWTFAAADASASAEARPSTRRLAFGAAHARGGVRACTFLTVEADVLASASEDRTVRLWDLQTGSCLCALVGARAAAESVAFSPDGAFLLAGVADGSLVAWRDASGSRGARFPSRGRENETAFAVALLEARVTLGARTLLAPPPDPAAAAAAERRGGAVGVDAACVASADASAREDAEAFLPRVDTPAIAGLVLRVNSGASGDDFARKTLSAKNADPAAVSCAICGAPAWFSVADGPDATARDGADWCMPLPCGHAFHARACILPWLTRGETTCPLCRRRVVEGGGEQTPVCLWTTRRHRDARGEV